MLADAHSLGSASAASVSSRPPLAVGANCGVGASDLLASVLAMKAGSDLPIIAKANCGIPQWHGDHIHYSGTPELMARFTNDTEQIDTCDTNCWLFCLTGTMFLHWIPMTLKRTALREHFNIEGDVCRDGMVSLVDLRISFLA